jgi:hypothetical protein
MRALFVLLTVCGTALVAPLATSAQAPPTPPPPPTNEPPTPPPPPCSSPSDFCFPPEPILFVPPGADERCVDRVFTKFYFPADTLLRRLTERVFDRHGDAAATAFYIPAKALLVRKAEALLARC